MDKKLQAVRGMNDVLPDQTAALHRADRAARLLDQPDQLQRLVGRDPAADDQKYALASQHDDPIRFSGR